MSCRRQAQTVMRTGVTNGIAPTAGQSAYYAGQNSPEWKAFKAKYLAGIAKKPPEVEVVEAQPGTVDFYGTGKTRTKVLAVSRDDPDSWPAWIQAHAKKLNMPPLYSNLHIPPKKVSSGLLWVGTKNSRNGRLRRHGEYLPQAREQGQRQKWRQVIALNRRFPQIENEIRQAAAQGNETAMCLVLISSLGIRADAKNGSRAAKNILPDGTLVGGDFRFGATSLQTRHIKFVPNNPHLIKLEFPGKGTAVRAKTNTRWITDDPAFDRTPHVTRVRQLLRKKERGLELSHSEEKDVDTAYRFLCTNRVVYDPQLFTFLRERRLEAGGATGRPVFNTSYQQLKRYVDQLSEKYRVDVTPHNFRHRICTQRFEELCEAAAARWDIRSPLDFSEELMGTRHERRLARATGRQAGLLGIAADFINDSVAKAAGSYINPESEVLGRLRKNVQAVDQDGVPWEWRPNTLTYAKMVSRPTPAE